MKQLSTLVFCLLFATAHAQSINVEQLEDDPRSHQRNVLTFGIFTSNQFGSGLSGDAYGLGVSGMYIINDDLDIYANLGVGFNALDIEPVAQYFFYDQQMRRRMLTLIGSSYNTNTYLRTDQEYLMRLGVRGGFHYLIKSPGFFEDGFQWTTADGNTTVGSLFFGGVFNGRRAGKLNAEGVGLIKFATDANYFADVMLPVVTASKLPGGNDALTSGLGWRVGANNRVKQKLIGNASYFFSYQLEIGQYADLFVEGSDTRPLSIRVFAGIGFGF